MPKKKLKVVPNKKGSMIHWHSYLGDTAGCGFIRVIIPNTLMLQKFHGNIRFNPSYNSKFILDPKFYDDKMFMVVQRGATQAHLEIIKMFKSKLPKLKIIYEIDDNLMIIPEWNFASQYYQHNKPYIEEILKNVDGIVTSTKPLKDQLLSYNSNITISENHLPKYIWGDIPEIKEREGKTRILWSGSANHFALPNSEMEGGDIGKELLDYIRKTVDNYQWVFMGAIPNELDDLRKEGKIEFHKWKNILEYPSFLKSLDIDIGLAPLIDHPFNHAKSNIKALEYIAAGITGIYSNVSPYYGLSNLCDNCDQFIKNIEILANDVNKRKEVWENDYQQLKNQLYWEENENLVKYMNSFFWLLGYKLPPLQ